MQNGNVCLQSIGMELQAKIRAGTSGNERNQSATQFGSIVTRVALRMRTDSDNGLSQNDRRKDKILVIEVLPQLKLLGYTVAF